jgi:addiction module HigA family antidote
MMTINPLTKGIRPIHPGEMLREDVLPALGKTKVEIAGLLGVSRQTLYAILDEVRPITPQMALRIGKLCGNGPELWLNLQRRYDLQMAEREIGKELAKIPTLTEAA